MSYELVFGVGFLKCLGNSRNQGSGLGAASGAATGAASGAGKAAAEAMAAKPAIARSWENCIVALELVDLWSFR